MADDYSYYMRDYKPTYGSGVGSDGYKIKSKPTEPAKDTNTGLTLIPGQLTATNPVVVPNQSTVNSLFSKTGSNSAGVDSAVTDANSNTITAEVCIDFNKIFSNVAKKIKPSTAESEKIKNAAEPSIASKFETKMEKAQNNINAAADWLEGKLNSPLEDLQKKITSATDDINSFIEEKTKKLQNGVNTATTTVNGGLGAFSKGVNTGLGKIGLGAKTGSGGGLASMANDFGVSVNLGSFGIKGGFGLTNGSFGLKGGGLSGGSASITPPNLSVKAEGLGGLAALAAAGAGAASLFSSIKKSNALKNISKKVNSTVKSVL